MKSDEAGFVLSQGAELRLQKFRQNYGFELHTKKTMPTCHFEDQSTLRPKEQAEKKKKKRKEVNEVMRSMRVTRERGSCLSCRIDRSFVP